MPPLDFTQLGIAAIVAALLWWFLNKIIAGDLSPKSTTEALKDRIAQAEADKLAMAAQNASLAMALAASSQQVQTALEIATKALAEE